MNDTGSTSNNLNELTAKQGSLVCVGIGMLLGAHLTPICKSHIEDADVVFISGNNAFIKEWLSQLNNNVVDLQEYYQEGKSRSLTYDQMSEIMLAAMREGKKVVGAFYGHPGVFVTPAHKAIKQATKEGYFAKMEAGISAEDCLIADCGIDPGSVGLASFEANQFIRFKRQVDNSAYLVLWQVGVVGDCNLTRFSTGSEYRAVLVDVLLQHYPQEHPVILYQAATLAIEKTIINKLPLKDIIDAEVNQCTTLIIPPCKRLVVNKQVMEKLQQLDKQRTTPSLTAIK
ncbi:SAM-dependent methyltransferase [Thalassomonas sp. M1454]|uniref:SAM-dependent methyltransferase n=1 Tax=Thalassomonas sp. M1454 TaxID=2594477 RepID=UPI00117F7108|nr:SAM-dependent methyltransferase [Thalassomonas sp. M1454]TRX54520.1 hypothetical protein FNN08_12390 [Thalassomonas sp. M1454]